MQSKLPTKAAAMLLAERLAIKLSVYFWNGNYYLIPSYREHHIRVDATIVYKTQKDENRILVYDEGNRHVREEIVDPDGRLISRRSYVKPKTQVVERDRKKGSIPVRSGRQNHRSGSF